MTPPVTPAEGGWTVEHGADDYFYVAKADGLSFDPDEIADVERKIAAAPELFEALADVIVALEVDRGSGGEWPVFEAWEAKARAALAKACGQ